MSAWLRQNAAVLAVGVGLAGVLYQVSDVVGRMAALETKMDALSELVADNRAAIADNRAAIADIQARLPTLAAKEEPKQRR
ncbi:MAG: hypothetical protein OXF26_05480 [Alphaproteobacteria bacterium]|nr:hypothetical protein [Alphaproteobacteria bacterium]